MTETTQHIRKVDLLQPYPSSTLTPGSLQVRQEARCETKYRVARTTADAVSKDV